MERRFRFSRRTFVANALGAAGAFTVARNAHAAPRRAAFGGATETAVRYWYSENSGIGPALPALLEQFKEVRPEITVVPRSYLATPTAMQALGATVASDEQPAAMATAVQTLQNALAISEKPALAQVGYGLLRYAASLPHLSIADAAANDADASGFLARFADQILALGQVDGVQHGLPFTVAGTCLHCNADLFQQAGMTEMPRTWSDVRRDARVIRDKTGVTGLSLPDSGDLWNLQTLLESHGARLLINDGGRYRTGIASPEAIAAMQLYAAMVLEDRTALPTRWEEGISRFVNGQIAMVMGGSKVALAATGGARFKIIAIQVPTFNDLPRRVPVAGHNHFILATRPDEQAAAWAWLRFLNTPRSVTAWIENTGFLPPISGLADDPRYLKPYFDRFAPGRIELEQMPDMVPWLSWPGPNGLAAAKALIDAREKILSGALDVATALGEAARQIDEALRS